MPKSKDRRDSNGFNKNVNQECVISDEQKEYLESFIRCIIRNCSQTESSQKIPKDY